MTVRAPSFGTIVDALDTEGVRYAVIGAAARNVWAPPRLSTDFDFAVLIDETAYEALVDRLAGLGYSLTQTSNVDPNQLVPDVASFRNDELAPPLRQIDILFAHTRFEREAVEAAVDRRVGGQPVRVVTREHLITYKLIAWRARDREDVADVVATAEAAEIPIEWDLIRRWAREWNVLDRLEKVRPTSV